MDQLKQELSLPKKRVYRQKLKDTSEDNHDDIINTSIEFMRAKNQSISKDDQIVKQKSYQSNQSNQSENNSIQKLQQQQQQQQQQQVQGQSSERKQKSIQEFKKGPTIAVYDDGENDNQFQSKEQLQKPELEIQFSDSKRVKQDSFIKQESYVSNQSSSSLKRSPEPKSSKKNSVGFQQTPKNAEVDSFDELKPQRYNDRKSKLSLQNKNIMKNQQLYQQDIEERYNEQKRDEILDQIKKQLAFKRIHPFDLFITYDDLTIEYQIRLFEFEMALNQIDVQLDRKSQQILLKYFKVPDAESIASLKLCWSLVSDVGELLLLALNYMINKYRMIYEVVFNEITGPDKMVTVDVLMKLNQEFNWNLSEEQISKGYRALTDYGNTFLDYFQFKKKLDSVTTQQKSKYNESSYLILQNAIIETGKGKLDQIKNYLAEQDQTQQGELGLYSFMDLLAMYFNRAVSKQEIMAINVYLIKPNEDNIVIYSKLINDTQKTLEEKELQYQSMQETIKRKQDELIQLYFDSIVDQETELHAQYFKGEKQFAIDKDTFINTTIKATGFQLDEEKANQLYAIIVENKPTNQENTINVHEFKQFLDLYKKAEKQEIGEGEQKVVVRSIKTDIYMLFDQLDTKKIKSLTPNQLYYGLVKIGLLVPKQELTAHKAFDYSLFEKITLRLLSTSCYNVKKTIYNMKREFEFIKDTDDDQIAMPVLKQICDILQLGLTFEDIIQFYQILDTERSGSIKLSDLFYMIYQHPQIDFKLNELIFKVKGYKDYTIPTMKKQFSNLPDNFIKPFTDKTINLVSHSFKFKPDYLGSVQSALLTKNSNKKLFKFKILATQGIPSPADPSNIFRRECVVGIYDKFYKRFIENSITIKAFWKVETPDIWQLQSDFNPINKVLERYQRNVGFLMNCENVKYYQNYSLLFEFICYLQFKECNQPLKVSCGFSELSFEQIFFVPPRNKILEIGFNKFDYKEVNLQIYGGTPEQVISINPNDVRLKKSQKSPMPSQMTISIQLHSRRQSLVKESELLPPFCLIDRTMSQILYAYHKNAIEKMNDKQDIIRDPRFQIFLYCLDNPYVCNKMCRFWNNCMKGRLIGQEIKAFDIIVGQLLKLTKMKDFQFNPYSPNEIFLPDNCKEKKRAVASVLLYTHFLFDLNFLLQLGLDGNVILDEQLNLYGQSLQQDLFNTQNDLFDQFHNGLNLDAYIELTTI